MDATRLLDRILDEFGLIVCGGRLIGTRHYGPA
jgi:hypothetical protein